MNINKQNKDSLIAQQIAEYNLMKQQKMRHNNIGSMNVPSSFQNTANNTNTNNKNNTVIKNEENKNVPLNLIELYSVTNQHAINIHFIKSNSDSYTDNIEVSLSTFRLNR